MGFGVGCSTVVAALLSSSTPIAAGAAASAVSEVVGPPTTHSSTTPRGACQRVAAEPSFFSVFRHFTPRGRNVPRYPSGVRFVVVACPRAAGPRAVGRPAGCRCSGATCLHEPCGASVQVSVPARARSLRSVLGTMLNLGISQGRAARARAAAISGSRRKRDAVKAESRSCCPFSLPCPWRRGLRGRSRD